MFSLPSDKGKMGLDGLDLSCSSEQNDGGLVVCTTL